MKGLYQFINKFDYESFFAGKEIVVTDINDAKDKDTGKVLGRTYECAIVRDETKYNPGKNGKTISNLYEKFPITVKQPYTANANIGDEVVPDIISATVSGDFKERLYIGAKGLAVKPQKAKE